MPEESAAPQGPVTFINVFEIPAAEVDEILDEWHRRAELISKQPGFLGYQLHRALSSETTFQLINIAQWTSREAFQSAMSTPEVRKTLDAARERIKAHPGLFQVIDSYEIPA